MEAKINVKITGVRGGSPSYQENKGRVVTFVDDGHDYIAVDAFDGMGETYKRREKSEIEITIGKISWRGTKQELLKLISPLSEEDKILADLGEYLATDAEHFPKVVNALKKALKKKPDELVDYIEFDAGSDDEVCMETISMWEPLEGKYTVKQFCKMVGIEA